MDIEQVPAADWETWLSDHADGVLLDIREPDEWEMGTLPGAVRMSMGLLPSSLDQLDPAAPHLVICRSGQRSQQVAQYLTMNGFEDVANLAGGMKALGMQP
jgi:rhodanese-related sulfurtransferase